MLSPIQYQEQASSLLEQYRKRNLKLVTAESCTGGMIASLMTDIAGSSDVFECGFVTYSNASKINLLGVDSSLIEQYGAVSEQVAVAMAQGALEKANADVAVSVTGIAGPGGGTEEKPVGLVYIVVSTKNDTVCEKNLFSGNRQEIRLNSLEKAVEMLTAIKLL